MNMALLQGKCQKTCKICCDFTNNLNLNSLKMPIGTFGGKCLKTQLPSSKKFNLLCHFLPAQF